MPPTNYVWPPGDRSVGYAWSRSAPALCSARWFSPRCFNSVPASATQQALRRLFAQWGLPQRLRVDNGHPWGIHQDMPQVLALWLVGLGIKLHWNPPACPQHNGVVEVGQRTGQRWAEPWLCRSPGQLQKRIDEEDRVQREVYPVAGGKSRWELFGMLLHSGRPYSQQWEAEHWDLPLVWEHLGGYRWQRRVNSQGRISVYAHEVWVGTAQRGREVYVGFDPVQGDWVIQDDQGAFLIRQVKPVISREVIVNLQLSAKQGNRRIT